MQVSTHLQFGGNCRQAFEAYRAIFGGELFSLSYGDSPMADDVSENWRDRIVHATLKVAGFELSGSDIPAPNFREPQGFSVLMTLDDAGETRRIFDALLTGGHAVFAFGPTFWSPGYGMLVDAFGIPWELNTGVDAD